MTLKYSKGKLHNICRKNHVKYLGLFGSYARGQSGELSDIDFLVEYAKPKSFFTHLDTIYDLEKLFNKKVDLVTKASLGEEIGKQIAKDVVVFYEKKNMGKASTYRSCN